MTMRDLREEVSISRDGQSVGPLVGRSVGWSGRRAVVALAVVAGADE